MNIGDMTREELKAFLAEEVLTSSEAYKLLGIQRARLGQLVAENRIVPIKKTQRDSLFLKSELLEKKEEMETLRKKYRPYEYEDYTRPAKR